MTQTGQDRTPARLLQSGRRPGVLNQNNYPERFTPLHPQSVAMRTLLSLTEHRRELVNDKTRLTNRLTGRGAYSTCVANWVVQTEEVRKPIVCETALRRPLL